MPSTKQETAEMKLVRTHSGVSEYALTNGLRVLHRFDDSAPVVAVMVTYHVGSRNEAVGHTGSTHILEHLLFKDSENFNEKNGKAAANYLESLGANLNATTWLDRTNYYELLPKEHAEEAIALEADRMRGSLFSAADLATEMTVVRNEYERGRNNPEELLDEAVWATAFMAHPYHHPTIGWKDDIEASTVERLRDFYNRFYYPNNATLSIFGDIDEPTMQTLVQKHFGRLKESKEEIPRLRITEAEQEGARSIEVLGKGATTIVTLAHKAPEGLSPEFPAYLVLSQILAGGLASRLQRALVDTGKAVYAVSSVHAFHDPSILTLSAQTTPGTKPDAVLAIMRREIASLQKKAPAAEELRRAKEQILAQLSYARDGILNELFAVNEAIAAGDWALAYDLAEKVKGATAADILRIARAALVPARETLGILRPKDARTTAKKK
jgi:zinc protease